MIRLGSRGSSLAMTQSGTVAAQLAKATGETQSPIQPFVTSGDRIADRRLQDVGGKGLFTKELDEALLDHRIDAAIHSLKDLPTLMPDGIVLAAIPSREDPRDAFIAPHATGLMALPEGAIVGTASLRRQAQTLHMRPDLKIVTLRGSVQTRLRHLAEGTVHATYLALSGLTRMGLQHHATALMDANIMPPAPGQGALAITCRVDDVRTRAILTKISAPIHEIEISAERGFLHALDGSCRTPIGALARIEGNDLHFLGEVLSPNGARRWRREAHIQLADNPIEQADALGRKLGREIRAEAGVKYQPEHAAGW